MLVIALLGFSLICSIVLVAAMVVASRANGRATDTLESLHRISQPRPRADAAVSHREAAMPTDSLPSQSTVAAHRNTAEEMRTAINADHERQGVQPQETTRRDSPVLSALMDENRTTD